MLGRLLLVPAPVLLLRGTRVRAGLDQFRGAFASKQLILYRDRDTVFHSRNIMNSESLVAPAVQDMKRS
jgi:hypothetical protein